MKSEKGSGVHILSDLSVEMRQSIVRLGGERDWFDTRGSWLAKAARAAGISYRSAKSLFYAETADPRASVVEKVRRAVRERDEAAEAQDRAEYRAIIERIARLETALMVSDEAFHSETVTGLQQALRGAGSKDRAVDGD